MLKLKIVKFRMCSGYVTAHVDLLHFILDPITLFCPALIIYFCECIIGNMM